MRQGMPHWVETGRFSAALAEEMVQKSRRPAAGEARHHCLARGWLVHLSLDRRPKQMDQAANVGNGSKTEIRNAVDPASDRGVPSTAALMLRRVNNLARLLVQRSTCLSRFPVAA